MLEEVIESYREERISDAEYLSRVTDVMKSVRDRTGDELPAALRTHEVAKAFYGVVNDVLSSNNGAIVNRNQLAATVALKIDELIVSNRVVDWTTNLDVQNQMRNQIDDYLYEIKEENEIDLTFEDMDFIIESALKIAKARYA